MQLTSALDDVLQALAAQNDEIEGMLRGLDDAGWARPSRCPGWTIADVVLHLAQTNEMAVASAEHRFNDVTAAFGSAAGAAPPGATVDDLAGLAVAAERGKPPGEVHERWRASCEAQAAAFGACDAGTRLRWVAGELSAVTRATTRLAETWIHAGDIADGLGRELTPGPHLKPIVRLAWLAPGTHVNAVGSSVPWARELDSDVVAGAGLFVDRRESTLNESGDYLAAVEEAGIGPDHIRAELGELLVGSRPGRRNPDELTVFKSLGLAVEDLAAAALCVERARQHGLGTEVEF